MLNDLYAYNPEENTVQQLLSVGPIPQGRYGAGMTSTPDSKIYLFSGNNGSGEWHCGT